MAENALYAQQEQLEDDLKNKYKQNWGTLMNFLGTYFPSLPPLED